VIYWTHNDKLKESNYEKKVFDHSTLTCKVIIADVVYDNGQIDDVSVDNERRKVLL
jgi:hypothetical protein